MKTQYYTATSLDGFIATENDSARQVGPGFAELHYEVPKVEAGRGESW